MFFRKLWLGVFLEKCGFSTFISQFFNVLFLLYDILDGKQWKDRWLPGFQRERQGLTGGLPRDWSGSETILYDTGMVDTWHYALIKIHRILKSKE